MGNLFSPELFKLERDINLLLVGKTGNGKSSTGNTILGKKVYVVDDTGNPVTYHAVLQKSKRFDKTVTVVDGPGTLCATNESYVERMEILIQSFYEGFKLCPTGFDAILLVMEYSSRFLKEDKESIDILRKAFGKSFIRDHCILIFTRGENWDLNRREKKHLCKTFEDWCKEQKGGLGELIVECNRTVLFYNLRPSLEVETVSKLCSLVEKSSIKRYTNDKFKMQHKDCQLLIVELQKETLTGGFRKEIQNISDELDNGQRSLKTSEIVPTLNKLHNKTSRLQEKVETADRKTGVLQEEMQAVEKLLERIETKQSDIMLCNRRE